MKTEKSRGVAGEGECGDDVAGLLGRERRSLNILPVKKRKSASEEPGEVVGSCKEDLRCIRLLTVCTQTLGLSEANDTRLWYW